MYIYYCFIAESCPGANIPVVYDHNVSITDSEGEDLYESFKCAQLAIIFTTDQRAGDTLVVPSEGDTLTAGNEGT